MPRASQKFELTGTGFLHLRELRGKEKPSERNVAEEHLLQLIVDGKDTAEELKVAHPESWSKTMSRLRRMKRMNWIQGPGDDTEE